MTAPFVYADFHNADRTGRVRLNSIGTLEDLADQQVRLREGLPLTLYSDDETADGRPAELQLDGTATYSDDERCWVAVVDWNAVRRIIPPAGTANGTPPVSGTIPAATHPRTPAN